MNGIFDWVKSIVFYLILLTVVTNLLPSRKYEKYVKLFTGMLLVIIVIHPVSQVFSWDETFDKNFMEMLSEGESFSIDDTKVDFENVQEEQFMEEYKRQLEAFVSSQAGSLGMDVLQFQSKVENQDGVLVPTAIRMEVTRVEEVGSGEGAPGENAAKTKLVEIEEIKIADIAAGERAVSEGEQTTQLRNILMQYYGLTENQIQIVMV